MSDNKKILLSYLLYFLTFILICFIGISGVFADTIDTYSTKYYYYFANNNSSTSSTPYRTGESNKVTLDGATAPTYANGEGFNGFDNQISYSITKGSIYTLSLTVSYNGLLDSEFSRDTINNRLFNTNFVHCSDCTVTAISGTIRRFSSTNQGVSGLYDFDVRVNYTILATSNASTWYLGSYTGDDRTLGLDNHLYTSIVTVHTLNISNDNNSTIINQNQTIIDQNNQIINGNNQNTQDIINNNNTNTENIINNQNENTDKEIESQKVCNLYDKSNIIIDNKYLDYNGNILDTQRAGITDYISIKKSTISVIETYNDSRYLCFYNENKSVISCLSENNIPLNDIDIPSNASYVRFSIDKILNKPQFKVCTDGNQALNDSISGLNDSLNDDDSSGASSEASEFFNSFTTNTFGLTSIITAPLNLIQSLTSSTCTELHLPLPYLNNKYLDLPCMTSIYQTHFGTFFTMYQTITYGIIAYWVIVRIFNQVKDFKNPEHDEIEVVDL